MTPYATPLSAAPRRPSRAATALALSALLGLAWLFGSPAAAEGPYGGAEAARAPTRWSEEIVELASRLPVQEGGRVMPLQTWAGFTLLKMADRRGSRDDTGADRPALEIVLDVLFRPERARDYPMFVVTTHETLDAVGLSQVEGKKRGRDRYAYADLLPAREKFSQMAASLQGKDADERAPVEAGILKVAHNLRTWEGLASFLRWARDPIETSRYPALAAKFPGVERVAFSEALAQVAALRAEAEGQGEAAKAAQAALGAIVDRAGDSDLLSILPPVASAANEPEWLTPSHLLTKAFMGEPISPAHVQVLQAIERFAASVEDPVAASRAMEEWQGRVEALASARGEYGKVPLEVGLTNADPFGRALILYTLAFVLVAVGWLTSNRWLRRGTWVLLGLAFTLHVGGIVVRCILRDRPPISTLYETILFVSSFGVLLCFAVEWFSRAGIAFSLAPLLGSLGLFIANRYEIIEGKDTMPELVAVLDTNFWLATHVTCISIGYSAALLAALVAHVHVIGKLFGLKQGEPEFYRTVHRMTYGIGAFSLIFSVVGTILGGIWANESWGRFWGWDPKENGALLICLSQLAMIHGRLGGYLKATGIAIASIFTGCVVAFSWWGINLLNVGLHSYGFTEGLWSALKIVWGLEALVMIVGLVHHAVSQGASATPPAAA